MRAFQIKNKKICTLITFLMIPFSGLITDIYIPSFPDMQTTLDTSRVAVQLTLSYFLISYGVSMIFVGSLVDSFGRYKPVLISLFLLILSSLAIAVTKNIYVIYAMRIVQGMSTAMIVVGKRAFLVDLYKGERLKHFTSLLTVIWSTAPIAAPFIGGYLQNTFGWNANFLFLAFYAFICLVLELIFNGEALTTFKPFKYKYLIQSYKSVLSAPDFSLGVVFLGIIYAMTMVFGMSASFIIEHHFKLSPVITGYCALLSGLGMMIGGIIGKALYLKSFIKRIKAGVSILFLVSIIMLVTGYFYSNLILLVMFVFTLQMCVGFLYNVYFTYCLTVFPENAGIASGLTSGGSYLVTSLFSSIIVGCLLISDQWSLSFSYISLAFVLILIIPFVKKYTSKIVES